MLLWHARYAFHANPPAVAMVLAACLPALLLLHNKHPPATKHQGYVRHIKISNHRMNGHVPISTGAYQPGTYANAY